MEASENSAGPEALKKRRPWLGKDYLAVPFCLLRAKRFSRTAKHVVSLLRFRQDRSPSIVMGQRLIGKTLGVSANAVCRAIRELVKAELLCRLTTKPSGRGAYDARSLDTYVEEHSQKRSTAKGEAEKPYTEGTHPTVHERCTDSAKPSTKHGHKRTRNMDTERRREFIKKGKKERGNSLIPSLKKEGCRKEVDNLTRSEKKSSSPVHPNEQASATDKVDSMIISLCNEAFGGDFLLGKNPDTHLGELAARLWEIRKKIGETRKDILLALLGEVKKAIDRGSWTLPIFLANLLRYPLWNPILKKHGLCYRDNELCGLYGNPEDSEEDGDPTTNSYSDLVRKYSKRNRDEEETAATHADWLKPSPCPDPHADD